MDDGELSTVPVALFICRPDMTPGSLEISVVL